MRRLAEDRLSPQVVHGLILNFIGTYLFTLYFSTAFSLLLLGEFGRKQFTEFGKGTFPVASGQLHKAISGTDGS